MTDSLKSRLNSPLLCILACTLSHTPSCSRAPTWWRRCGSLSPRTQSHTPFCTRSCSACPVHISSEQRKRGQHKLVASGGGKAFCIYVCVLEDVCDVMEKLRNRWGFILLDGALTRLETSQKQVVGKLAQVKWRHDRKWYLSSIFVQITMYKSMHVRCTCIVTNLNNTSCIVCEINQIISLFSLHA